MSSLKELLNVTDRARRINMQKEMGRALLILVEQHIKTYECIKSYETLFLENDAGEKDTLYVEIELDEDIYLAEILTGKQKVEKTIELIVGRFDPYLVAIEINGKSVYNKGEN